MRSIELFSGAGGLALGLEEAGFQTSALYEFNKHACQTLRQNRPQWNVYEGDVRRADFSIPQAIDLVAGGPPCQPFSMGGKAKGSDDLRDMFPQAVRAVRELQPRAFIFENVRGLLRPAFRNYVEFIRLQLTYPEFPISLNADWETNLSRLQRHHTDHARSESLSYQVSMHLVNAADYGVPQHRHRVFFIGFRNDLSVRWSFPKPTHSNDQLIVSKYVTNEYWEHHSLNSPSKIPDKLRKRVEMLRSPSFLDTSSAWQTVRDALYGLQDPREPSELKNHVYQGGARSYPGHTGSPLDEPSKALKAGDHGVPGGENMLRHANGKVRYFSIRESCRVQTFPDDYSFDGSWTESMRQLGNAVPVKLAGIVARSVALTLSKNGQRKSLQPSR